MLLKGRASELQYFRHPALGAYYPISWQNWWSRRASLPLPSTCHADALLIELLPQGGGDDRSCTCLTDLARICRRYGTCVPKVEAVLRIALRYSGFAGHGLATWLNRQKVVGREGLEPPVWDCTLKGCTVRRYRNRPEKWCSRRVLQSRPQRWQRRALLLSYYCVPPPPSLTRKRRGSNKMNLRLPGCRPFLCLEDFSLRKKISSLAANYPQ